MRIGKLCGAALAALLFAAPVANSAPAVSIDDIASNAALSFAGAPFSVAVARGGKLLFAKGYNGADQNTAYHIDSISKHITASAILMLVSQGKLRLEDSVRKSVPELPAGFDGINIVSLLNHTAGIKSYTTLSVWDDAKPMKSEDIIGLIASQPFEFSPGTNWRYSNSGYYLLGRVIEAASHIPYGEFVQKNIFAPLGMSASSYGCATKGHTYKDHTLIEAPEIYWDGAYAGGNLCASAQDLLAFEAALRGGKIAPKNLVMQMSTPTHLKDGSLIDYGFGTRLGTLNGRRVWGHTGTGGGFHNVVEYFPDSDLTIAVLIASDSASAVSLATEIARAELGTPYEPPINARLSRNQFQRIEGVYESEQGPIEVYRLEKEIFARPKGSTLKGSILRFLGVDRFELSPDVNVRFVGAPRAQWAIEYDGGLMLDAGRRLE